MTQTNVYIINPVLMGFQLQICPILLVFWSILVKCCLSANELQQNSNAFSREDYIPQELKQCNYSVDQSALLTGFRTDFTSSVWNFCRWVADVPPRETSPSTKSEEKRMFSQANLIGIIIEEDMWCIKIIIWRISGIVWVKINEKKNISHLH